MIRPESVSRSAAELGLEWVCLVPKPARPLSVAHNLSLSKSFLHSVLGNCTARPVPQQMNLEDADGRWVARGKGQELDRTQRDGDPTWAWRAASSLGGHRRDDHPQVTALLSGVCPGSASSHAFPSLSCLPPSFLSPSPLQRTHTASLDNLEKVSVLCVSSLGL